jgi:hypothetical protein
VTARQPFLGKIEWIKKDIEKIEGIKAAKKEPETAGKIET